MGSIKIVFPIEKVKNAVQFYKNKAYVDGYANELYHQCNGSYMPNKGQDGWGSVNSQWGVEISKNKEILGLEFIEMNVISRLKSDTGEKVKSSHWKIL